MISPAGISSPSASKDSSMRDLVDELIRQIQQGGPIDVEGLAGHDARRAEQLGQLLPILERLNDLGLSITSACVAGHARHDQSNPGLRSLGDFRIVREVGRGGMGVVYEAVQASLGRRVALKILSEPNLLDPRKVSRFHREARAAANLHHTNIVPVFGVGEEDGLHYYVMQFIPGLSLDEVLEELRRLRARKAPSEMGRVAAPREPGISAADLAQSLWTARFPAFASVTSTESEPRAPTASELGVGAPDPSSSVSLPGEPDLSAVADSTRRYVRSVARIGEQVAEALEYAHQQGIWHRDIKPSNLLLDAHGTVWVADFGLAKASDDDDLTHTGDVVGTVRYMAPERFRGRCDARSDVYALGLTLYELLAFRPAFPGGDRHELIRRIAQEEPPRLRRLDPSIPRDL